MHPFEIGDIIYNIFVQYIEILLNDFNVVKSIGKSGQCSPFDNLRNGNCDFISYISKHYYGLERECRKNMMNFAAVNTTSRRVYLTRLSAFTNNKSRLLIKFKDTEQFENERVCNFSTKYLRFLYTPPISQILFKSGDIYPLAICAQIDQYSSMDGESGYKRLLYVIIDNFIDEVNICIRRNDKSLVKLISYGRNLRSGMSVKCDNFKNNMWINYMIQPAEDIAKIMNVISEFIYENCKDRPKSGCEYGLISLWQKLNY